MPPPRPILLLLSLLSHLAACPNRVVSAYTILGGLDDATSSSDFDNDDSKVIETLRHLPPPLDRIELRTQAHEPTSGRVSMAGTLWEASPLLADYVTNPVCPCETLRRGRRRDEDHDATAGDAASANEPATVVELGAGVGLASLAAALAGCNVVATDGSPSSVRLLNENFEQYAGHCPIRPRAFLLEWGDDDDADALMMEQLFGKCPDVVMASDVVYAHSAREELSRTVRKLCPAGHMRGRIVIAHRWRANPEDEESFFKSFDDEFDREEVGLEFLPQDSYYRRRSMLDMKYPVSIFEMRRKW